MPDETPTISDAEIAAAFHVVRGRLLEWLGTGGDDRDDRTPIEWIVRRYQGMEPASARSLAAACARALLDPEPKVRSGAIHFFSALLEADDDGALLDAVNHHAELFGEIPDPFQEDAVLGEELLRVATVRLDPKEPAQLETLRRLLLGCGRAEAFVAWMMRHDLDWVEANAVAILRGSPAATQYLLVNLVRYGRPVLPVVAALRGVIPAATLEHASPRPADRRASGRGARLAHVNGRAWSDR